MNISILINAISNWCNSSGYNRPDGFAHDINQFHFFVICALEQIEVLPDTSIQCLVKYRHLNCWNCN